MASPRKTKKGGKRYRIDLSLGAFLFWTGGLLVLLGWIFVLGIMVGRGDGPDFMKAFLPKEQSGVPIARDPVPAGFSAEVSADPELRFYEELESKKQRVVRKDSPQKGSLPAGARVTAGESAPPATPPAGEVAGYAVQVASLDTEEGAVDMVRRLSRAGYKAYFTRADVRGRVYFRVRCGPYSNRNEATRAMAELAGREGLDGFLLETGS